MSCSLDDFYLSSKQREKLANVIHPLLKTRGVPGTHDIELLASTLEKFRQQKVNWSLTKFDKSSDNPSVKTLWPIINKAYDVIIIEGWCWGILPQPNVELTRGINALESNQDKELIWRSYVNQQLKEYYQPLYQKMDLWVMLQAPSFDVVYQWRLEQEKKLQHNNNQLLNKKSSNNKIMDSKEIEHFIQHFQRLTEHALETLPYNVDLLIKLDKNRNVI